MSTRDVDIFISVSRKKENTLLNYSYLISRGTREVVPMASRNRVLLPALVAMTAYLPFEVVAKMTLVAAAASWILNPFPGARLVSMAGVAAVLVAAKIRKVWIEGQSLADGDGALEGRSGGDGMSSNASAGEKES